MFTEQINISLFYSIELTEFEPLYPRQPIIEYSMDWFSETESPKITKARCRSPKQRLRQLESDIDNLSRIPVATRKKGRQAAQQVGTYNMCST